VAFQARDYAGALQHANRAIALDQEFWIGHQMRGQALEEFGDHDFALKALATAADFQARTACPRRRACRARDADAAFDWLDRADAARDVHLMFLTVDVKWDCYRTDPRFGDLLARCGFTTIGTRAGKAIER
jgi:hypothetical protein